MSSQLSWSRVLEHAEENTSTHKGTGSKNRYIGGTGMFTVDKKAERKRLKKKKRRQFRRERWERDQAQSSYLFMMSLRKAEGLDPTEQPVDPWGNEVGPRER